MIVQFPNNVALRQNLVGMFYNEELFIVVDGKKYIAVSYGFGDNCSELRFEFEFKPLDKPQQA